MTSLKSFLLLKTRDQIFWNKQMQYILHCLIHSDYIHVHIICSNVYTLWYMLHYCSHFCTSSLFVRNLPFNKYEFLSLYQHLIVPLISIRIHIHIYRMLKNYLKSSKSLDRSRKIEAKFPAVFFNEINTGSILYANI